MTAAGGRCRSQLCWLHAQLEHPPRVVKPAVIRMIKGHVVKRLVRNVIRFCAFYVRVLEGNAYVSIGAESSGRELCTSDTLLSVCP